MAFDELLFDRICRAVRTAMEEDVPVLSEPLPNDNSPIPEQEKPLEISSLEEPVLCESCKEAGASAPVLLPDQQDFEKLYSFISSLDHGTVEFMRLFFCLDSLPTFLVQCGQFSRISQIWAESYRAVSEGRHLPDISPVLCTLLELHNLAADNLMASLVCPEEESRYDFEICQRLESDGSRIESVLLPGLRNAGGKVIVKALVRLH